ncbi:hypothetical protein QWY84_11390 [Aquisalimonas lutea]|uniref:copper amine oxidase n=1 Tax=Aquisalimonas lutea TaxID=1327750 RepID=UPI0025B4D760|nr:hypothetical protein [Aquisalimonas lutea]MDN3518216.1 hypothetical protein [Aquisalimonas lutea]
MNRISTQSARGGHGSIRVAATAIGLLGCLALEAHANPQHPLDPLTPEEMESAVSVIRDSGRIDPEAAQFPFINLDNPDKDYVRGFSEGDALRRSAFVVVMEEGAVYEAVVDLQDEAVDEWSHKPDVEPSIMLGEWMMAQELVINHPDFQAALEKRGLESTEDIFCTPLSAGNFGDPEEEGLRLLKVPCFDTSQSVSNLYGHPIEGLYATVDLNNEEVISVEDSGPVAMSTDDHNYDEESVAEEHGLRDPLRPVVQHYPDGANYEIEGHFIEWQNWRFHYRLDQRVGTIISRVSYKDGDERRPILYEGHLSEIFVPYVDPDDAWAYRTYVDAGEYGAGLLASPLDRGRDCPAGASYLDATVMMEDGSPITLENVMCVFERNTGSPEWRHAEWVNETLESRPGVELVVRMATAIGNYDYFFDWVFTQSGEIRMDVGAAGIVITKGLDTEHMDDASAAEDTRYGTLVAPNLGAPYHDHFYSFRLDTEVDGGANTFIRMPYEVRELPDDRVRRSVWHPVQEIPETDTEARYQLSYRNPAMYLMVNENEETALGHNPGYMLLPRKNVSKLLLDDDPPQMRAGFTDHHIWVTPFDDDERYAAGNYPNQHPGGDGLPAWTEDERSIRNRDVVLWYTMGMRHVTRTEDWPIMPMHWQSFSLRPMNFFDRNPSLDLRRDFRD